MATTKTTETNPAPVPAAEELVRIRVPREDKDQEDKVVWVNDRRFLIKRGVYVDVPESVALILEQEEKALEVIYDYETKAQKHK